MFASWKAGPGKAFFDAVFKAVGNIEIIAEDLGVVTQDVVQLRKDIGAPGMAVLQFAFGSNADNPHLPHNHEKQQVVYTGTHDNDTIVGWWEAIGEAEKDTVRKYLSLADGTNISWAMIQCALSSVALTSVIMMQDILCLRSKARMNTPATQLGNWKWRVPSSTRFNNLKPEAEKLKGLISMYNRLISNQAFYIFKSKWCIELVLESIFYVKFMLSGLQRLAMWDVQSSVRPTRKFLRIRRGLKPWPSGSKFKFVNENQSFLVLGF